MKHKLLSLIIMSVICGQASAETGRVIVLRNVPDYNMNYGTPIDRGHVIHKSPGAPKSVELDGEMLSLNFGREEDAVITIFTLDGEQIGNYIISPEENSVTLSSDTPESFIIQIAVGDAVYEGIVEG